MVRLKKTSAVMKQTGRLNLILPVDLKSWAHEFAKANNTSLTAIIIAYLTELRRKEEEGDLDVEQI